MASKSNPASAALDGNGEDGGARRHGAPNLRTPKRGTPIPAVMAQVASAFSSSRRALRRDLRRDSRKCPTPPAIIATPTQGKDQIDDRVCPSLAGREVGYLW